MKTLTLYILKLFVLLLMITSYARGQQVHTFAFNNDDFVLDGKPFQIISGEMHPARIPKIYWKHRIQMAKAMGCNTIAVYLFWNYYEQQQWHFDFSSDNRDFTEFIKICQQEQMWVLLRPGPYVCAEWDFGGLPPYLLAMPDIKIRCSDRRYLTASSRYIDTISKQIKPLLCSNGGPILMLQIENEYGSYGNDKAYLEQLREMWLKNGINVPFYTSDGPSDPLLNAGTLNGVAIGLDPGISDADFDKAIKRTPRVPVFGGEIYPGWLTHWNEKWQEVKSEEIVKQVSYLLSHHRSFNFYVVHGGTNFGFTSGANAFNPQQFQPDVTSYDYDAPINEQGQPTPKYFFLRELIGKYSGHPLPRVPDPVKAIEVQNFELKAVTSVWQQLTDPIKCIQPLPMEALGQYQGLMDYRTKLLGHESGELTITEPHDFALVLLNGKLIDTIYRDGGKWTINIPKTNDAEKVLDILVENMGHINFAQYMIDRKGITDRVTLNGMTLMDWEQFKLPMNIDFVKTLKPAGDTSTVHDGIFYKGSFDLRQPADTYLDVSTCKKGIVWVNGHNLGRYWNTGPQQRLYCPASFLKKGKNEVLVLDLRATSFRLTMSGHKTLKSI